MFRGGNARKTALVVCSNAYNDLCVLLLKKDVLWTCKLLNYDPFLSGAKVDCASSVTPTKSCQQSPQL